MKPGSRRAFVRGVLAAAPLAAAANAAAGESSAKPLKVVCVGGHPDDPESACAGTLALYAKAGHEVAIVYLTRGEQGIPDKSNDEAAATRSAEAQAACEIIGAKAFFAGQIDGATEVNAARTDEMLKVLTGLAPDIVFTHWPIDTHRDHQAASLLTFRAMQALKPRPQLYYFEVNTGSQSLSFLPNVYVDVTPALEQKKSALLAHRSQGGESIWSRHHEPIPTWRGREAGVPMAEAFHHLSRGSKAVQVPMV